MIFVTIFLTVKTRMTDITNMMLAIFANLHHETKAQSSLHWLTNEVR